MQLDGAIALVTGAGSGIGRAVAVELSRRGARPILLGRSEGALVETRSLLAAPDAAWLCPLDLTDDAARAALPERVTALSGRLDLLVNNAGTVAAGPLSGQSDAE